MKKGGTLVTHGTAKRGTLSQKAKFTLGQGNLREAVKLPENEDVHEWIASNIVDFFNEVSLLYGLCADDAKKYSKPGEGFPPGYSYLIPSNSRTPIKCSSPEYVDYVMTWIEDQINNEAIFPVQATQSFPEDFVSTYAANIFKRLFRVFAIIYVRGGRPRAPLSPALTRTRAQQAHFPAIERVDAVGHLNTCFKHFVFFCLEFDLLEDKETQALEGPFLRLKEEYERGR